MNDWHRAAQADAHSLVSGQQRASFFSTVEAIHMVLTNENHARPGMVRHGLYDLNQNRFSTQAELYGSPKIVDTFGYTLLEANLSAIAVSSLFDRCGIQLTL
jgi:hypothetical protein